MIINFYDGYRERMKDNLDEDIYFSIYHKHISGQKIFLVHENIKDLILNNIIYVDTINDYFRERYYGHRI